jgi:hypothetical protein
VRKRWVSVADEGCCCCWRRDGWMVDDDDACNRWGEFALSFDCCCCCCCFQVLCLFKKRINKKKKSTLLLPMFRVKSSEVGDPRTAALLRDLFLEPPKNYILSPTMSRAMQSAGSRAMSPLSLPRVLQPCTPRHITSHLLFCQRVPHLDRRCTDLAGETFSQGFECLVFLGDRRKDHEAMLQCGDHKPHSTSP